MWSLFTSHDGLERKVRISLLYNVNKNTRTRIDFSMRHELDRTKN